MDIASAKQQIKNTVQIYLQKDALGRYRLPLVHQRPIFLLGAPGLGKTAIMQQVADEMGLGLVSYSMTHHTRQSALGLPVIVEKEYGGKHYQVSEYTSALLADAMKPLNVLSKFENHFAIRTVRFQVQLEADGYFSAQKFSHLRPPQAGRAGTTSQVLNLIFYKSSFKTLFGLRPNPIFSTRMR